MTIHESLGGISEAIEASRRINAVNPKCDHHSRRNAHYSNRVRMQYISRNAVWFYCAECANKFLTDSGKSEYSI